jgi:multisubunit Na+/H+ antiporter MnhB subunit
VRALTSAVLVVAAFVAVTAMNAAAGSPLDPFTYEYIAANFLQDTGSKNGVAAILLNYRMYDTMFEALILLTAIIGMNQFLPRRDDIERHAEAMRRKRASRGSGAERKDGDA